MEPPAGAPPRLLMRAVSKVFSGVRVLHEVSLEVRAGEVHGLVGENGAGKSTLTKILAGELSSDGGTLLWEGTPIRISSRSDSRRWGITMIHQELSLVNHLSVAANLFLGCEPVSRWGRLDRRMEVCQAEQFLAKLGFALDPSILVKHLNPAEKQLVEIARAVTGSSRLIIMDEPTSSLSLPEVEELLRVIGRLRKQNVAIIFVTHRLEELARIADRVTVMRDGRVTHHGEMPRKNFAPLIRTMVGRELREIYPSRKRQPGKVLLKIENLSRQGNFEGAGLEVRAGEIVGLAGLIGAGCTELAETLFGARPADTGRIRIEGRFITIRHPRDAIRAGMVLITEDRKATGLALSLPLSHNISLANLSSPRSGRENPVGGGTTGCPTLPGTIAHSRRLGLPESVGAERR